jgi:hypothetical protein
MNATPTPDAERPRAERQAKGARPTFYAQSGLDHAMSMILVLASELSVLRDRVDSMERVGKKHGIDFANEIDALELDQEALSARETARQELLRRLYYLASKEAQELAENDTGERLKQVVETCATE